MDINTAEELRSKVKEFRTNELIKMEGWLPGLLEGTASNGGSTYSTVDRDMTLIIKKNKDMLEAKGFKVTIEDDFSVISWE